jgi:hypothetical protein
MNNPFNFMGEFILVLLIVCLMILDLRLLFEVWG